jgi:hypothetical protein
MNINKREALVIAKLLHQHGFPFMTGEKTDFQVTVEYLEKRLQSFLTEDDSDVDLHKPKSDFRAGDLVRLGSVLHDLTPVKTTEGLVEFELFDDRTTVIIDGRTLKTIESIDSIRLGRTYLDILSGDERKSFIVNCGDWPKDWLKYMEFDTLYKIDHR